MGDVPDGKEKPLGETKNISQASSTSLDTITPFPLRHSSNSSTESSELRTTFQPSVSLGIPSANLTSYPPTETTSSLMSTGIYNIAQAQAHAQMRPPALNMGSMAGALPDYGIMPSYGQQNQQRLHTSVSTSAFVYQPQQISQYPSPTAVTYQNQQPYGVQLPQQYSNVYQGGHNIGSVPILHSQPSNPSGTHIPFSNQNWASPQQQQFSSFYILPQPYTSQPQVYTLQQAGNIGPYSTSYARRASISAADDMQRRQTTDMGAAVLGSEDPRPGLPGGPSLRPGSTSETQSRSPSDAQPSIPRGPPRKPRQSGHALWVGNLPPGTNVMDLKEHFSREATNDIESVFLISKSNCAFVNYKTEATCAAAMARFHDSRFQGARLVCRLRRSSAGSVPGVPSGPSSLSISQPGSAKSPTPSAAPEGDPHEVAQNEEINSVSEVGSNITPVKDKFFIVKSLTVGDLELSTRTGIWATQAHNEESLNKAYETSENVYLIFSANKSGEYFGYARMASSINDESAAAIDFAPRIQEIQDPDLPKAIPTPATEFAPKGRIIDDSTRGTIFWEAEPDEDPDDSTKKATDLSSDTSDQEGDEGATISKVWGKPFKIEWVSTSRLPFYRTRGLRNPWNSNREVKIARDGTELEPSVGRKLLQMFHRGVPGTAGPSAPGGLSAYPGMTMAGYPQMREY